MGIELYSSIEKKLLEDIKNYLQVSLDITEVKDKDKIINNLTNINEYVELYTKYRTDFVYMYSRILKNPMPINMEDIKKYFKNIKEYIIKEENDEVLSKMKKGLKDGFDNIKLNDYLSNNLTEYVLDTINAQIEIIDNNRKKENNNENNNEN